MSRLKLASVKVLQQVILKASLREAFKITHLDLSVVQVLLGSTLSKIYAMWMLRYGYRTQFSRYPASGLPAHLHPHQRES
jgi:hypothetical protein